MFGEYFEGICRSRVACQTLAGKIDKTENSCANVVVTMLGKSCVHFQHSANHERTWSDEQVVKFEWTEVKLAMQNWRRLLADRIEYRCQ